eukprot:Tbor_TRINITY_DN6044_c0_g5::TRINITY_DN6044_c0_g5_i1::g.11366::m.11366
MTALLAAFKTVLSYFTTEVPKPLPYPSARRLAADIVSVVVGGYIGYYHINIISRVDGLSMYPTLKPDERIIHVPLWLWGACHRWSPYYLLGVPGARDGGLREGDIVIVRVKPSVNVCKRVTRVTAACGRVEAELWEREVFLGAYEASCIPGEEYAWCDELEGEYTDMVTSDTVCEQDMGEYVSHGDEEGKGTDVIRHEDSNERGVCVSSNVEQADHRRRRNTDWDSCRNSPVTDGQWLWLSGDNISVSFDSRHSGAVPVECLQGVVVGRIWPINAIGIVI